MRKLRVVALAIVPLLALAAKAGADEKSWSIASGTRVADCAYCHGEKGEGGLGPDLAGRGITLEQFKTAVRKPWGMMPAYPNLTDERIADVYTYLESLPKPAKPADWRVGLPPESAPKAQRWLATLGCAQCHGPEMLRPRATMGGQGSDMTYEAFSKIVWEHIPMYPRNMMGQYSRDRLPEVAVKDIYDFIVQIGFRPQMGAVMAAPTQAGGNTTYSVTVSNNGRAGKGIAAEDFRVFLDLPAGAKVVSQTPDGWQGVQHDAERNIDVAVWKLAKIDAAVKQNYSVTIAGAPANPKSFQDSIVVWSKPEYRTLYGQVQDPSDEKRVPGFGKAMSKGDAVQINTNALTARPAQ